MREVRDAVGHVRASRTTFAAIPVEHEMINDELAASLEQILQGHLSVRPFEPVCLRDLDHRQRTSLHIQRIALVRERFFLRRAILAARQSAGDTIFGSFVMEPSEGSRRAESDWAPDVSRQAFDVRCSTFDV